MAKGQKKPYGNFNTNCLPDRSDKGFGRAMAEIATGFEGLSKACPEFAPILQRLLASMSGIYNQRLIVARKGSFLLSPQPIPGKNLFNISFQDLRVFPLFADAKLRSNLIPGEMATFDAFRQELMVLMRKQIGAKEPQPLPSRDLTPVTPITAPKPAPLEPPKLRKGFETQYLRAKKAAVEMVRKNYSFDFSVRTACKQAGYPVMAHVERGMRIEVGQDFIDARIAQVSSGRRGPDKPNPNRRTAGFRVTAEIKKSEDHFKTI